MHRVGVTSAGLVGLAGLLVVLTIVGAASVATGGVAAQETNATAGTNATNTTNETTAPHHENPETVNEQGDDSRVAGWLSSRLSERLRESSIQLSQGQYEIADDALGEEFEDRLGQYVDVAGETDDGGGGGDDENTAQDTANEFEEAQTNQRELVTKRQEYQETFREYREAQRRGEITRARSLARRLQRLAEDIRNRGGNTTRALSSIQNETGVDTSQTEERVTDVVQNVTASQRQVRTETFVETSLRVTTNRTEASFVSPVAVRGRLRTVNETAVANRTVQIHVGQQRKRATTSTNGTFVLPYRPVLVSPSADNVTVSYLPQVTSPYLGTDTNMSLQISQVEPTVTASVRPDEARFGDEIALDVSLSADGRPVPDVPIAATLADRSFGARQGQSQQQTRTNDAGMGQLRGIVTARDPQGEATIEAGVAREDLAIAPQTTTTTLSIGESSTNLSINATAGEGQIVIEGQLTAVSGGQQAIAVPDQSVRVRVGNTVRTVQTDRQGRYEATVAQSGVTASDGTLRVLASFDGDGLNLESASVETRLSVPAGSEGEDGSSGISIPLWAVAGVGLFVVVGVAMLVRRRGETETGQGTEPPTQSVQTERTDTEGETVEESEWWLRDARNALAENESERAVVSAYAAVRTNLIDAFDIDRANTSRELLARCTDHLDTDDETALATLVEVYERAAFAPTLDEDAGQTAVSSAKTLLDVDEDHTAEVADD